MEGSVSIRRRWRGVVRIYPAVFDPRNEMRRLRAVDEARDAAGAIALGDGY